MGKTSVAACDADMLYMSGAKGDQSEDLMLTISGFSAEPGRLFMCPAPRPVLGQNACWPRRPAVLCVGRAWLPLMLVSITMRNWVGLKSARPAEPVTWRVFILSILFDHCSWLEELHV